MLTKLKNQCFFVPVMKSKKCGYQAFMRASWDAVKKTFLGSYLVVVRVLNFQFSFQFALINL